MMQEFLQHTEIIDRSHPEIRKLARSLRAGPGNDPVATAARCYHWVRDEISHSLDVNADVVSCTASETLRNGTGLCYAKSHLLAAVLRANRIPAGLGYQRLSLNDEGTAFCLHGFNYVFLPEFGWYAVDARGNREGISTEFAPPAVSLAFETSLPGELTLNMICSAPLECVVQSLRSCRTTTALRSALPDWNAESELREA